MLENSATRAPPMYVSAASMTTNELGTQAGTGSREALLERVPLVDAVGVVDAVVDASPSTGRGDTLAEGVDAMLIVGEAE